MRHLRRLVPGLAVLALLAGLSAHRALRAGVALAQAQQVWDVQVGGDAEGGTISSASFWPDALTIRAGDTVRWTFVPSSEAHTVSFTPNGFPPLITLVPGPGDGEYTLGSSWFPIGPSGPDATYDGSQIVSSGADFAGADTPPYTLTFPKPGFYQYFCQLHYGMNGRLFVVTGDPPETPAQARTRGQNFFNTRLTNLNNNILTPDSGHPALPLGDVQATGETAGVHTVVAGLGFSGNLSKIQFLPGDLTVKRGDTVVWYDSDPGNRNHTVTFTSGAPLPDELAVRQQPSGEPLFVLTADTAQPAGGSTYTGQGFVSSGLLAPGRAFALTIDAPADTYAYACLIHRDVMKGTITVVE